jgi:dipeptidase E
MELLLLSNSTSDRGYLVDWLDLLADFLRGCREAVFVPYAGVGGTWDGYESRVVQALAPLALGVSSVHRSARPADALRRADCVLVGGGNTFNLLHHCRREGLLPVIAQRVGDGALRYAGWSAGANLACPTIRTTNDMPVVDPGGFDALGLVPFQINPHFTDAVPAGHHGETRSQRLAEFTTLNPDVPVLALPEGCHVRVSSTRWTLGGPCPALWLRHGAQPQAAEPGPLHVPGDREWD